MADDLTGLGARGFERMCQALASYALGPGIQVFGDGPDGGREASFDGRLRYPTAEEPWDGYGVLQAKYKEKVTTSGQDTAGSSAGSRPRWMPGPTRTSGGYATAAFLSI